jgi:hypothetical protein
MDMRSQTLRFLRNSRSRFRRYRFAHAQGVHTLYKFKGYSGEPRQHVQQILRQHQLYFSALDELNDPFDMRPAVRLAWDLTTRRGRKHYLAACEYMMRSLDPPMTEEDVRKQLQALATQDLQVHAEAAARITRENLKDFPIFCLSGYREEILSWTHYADQHRGLCIHFDSRTGVKSPFCFARRVIYSKRRPVFRVPLLPSNSFAVADGAALTKHLGWRYEDEFRLLSAPGESQGFRSWTGRVASFDGKLITGLTLGANMPNDSQGELIEIARTHIPRIPVWRAQIHPHKFRITFEAVGP